MLIVYSKKVGSNFVFFLISHTMHPSSDRAVVMYILIYKDKIVNSFLQENSEDLIVFIARLGDYAPPNLTRFLYREFRNISLLPFIWCRGN